MFLTSLTVVIIVYDVQEGLGRVQIEDFRSKTSKNIICRAHSCDSNRPGLALTSQIAM